MPTMTPADRVTPPPPRVPVTGSYPALSYPTPTVGDTVISRSEPAFFCRRAAITLALAGFAEVSAPFTRSTKSLSETSSALSFAGYKAISVTTQHLFTSETNSFRACPDERTTTPMPTPSRSVCAAYRSTDDRGTVPFGPAVASDATHITITTHLIVLLITSPWWSRPSPILR